MVVFAICECLTAQDARPGQQTFLNVSINDAEPRRIELKSGSLMRLEIPGSQLHHGPNAIDFNGEAPGAMYRAVVRHWKRGPNIEPLDKGLAVDRRFYLLDDKGKREREVRRGDTIPRGSYLASEVAARHGSNESMQYVLVENPKPSTCEILPRTDPRYPDVSTPYALREDRAFGVVYHHERTPASLTDTSILHVELAGRYLIAPARVELMYDTHTRGHSAAFEFRVE